MSNSISCRVKNYRIDIADCIIDGRAEFLMLTDPSVLAVAIVHRQRQDLAWLSLSPSAGEEKDAICRRKSLIKLIVL